MEAQIARARLVTACAVCLLLSAIILIYLFGTEEGRNKNSSSVSLLAISVPRYIGTIFPQAWQGNSNEFTNVRGQSAVVRQLASSLTGPLPAYAQDFETAPDTLYRGGEFVYRAKLPPMVVEASPSSPVLVRQPIIIMRTTTTRWTHPSEPNHGVPQSTGSDVQKMQEEIKRIEMVSIIDS